MSKFDKEHPLDHKGVKAYRNGAGELCVFPRSNSWRSWYVLDNVEAEAVAALIEAERADTWHWEVEGERARRGRWVAAWDTNAWLFGHDDFNGGVRNITPHWTRTEGTGDDRVDDVAAEVMDSFDAWHAAQAPADLEPEFTPLPVPEVGQYIRATYADGHVKTGEVEAHWVFEDCVGMQIAGGYGVILTKPRGTPELIDIAEWHEVERPKSSDLDEPKPAKSHTTTVNVTVDLDEMADSLERAAKALREAKS